MGASDSRKPFPHSEPSLWSLLDENKPRPAPHRGGHRGEHSGPGDGQTPFYRTANVQQSGGLKNNAENVDRFMPTLLQTFQHVFDQPTLNQLMSLPRSHWLETRSTLTALLSTDNPTLRDNGWLRDLAIVPQVVQHKMHGWA